MLSLNDNRRECVIILSGGMDSGVLLADTVGQGRSVNALSFNYSAKHNLVELEMAALLCKRYKVPQQIIKLDFIKSLLHSSLLQNDQAIPEGTYDQVNMSSTVVPFRNGIMLSIAVAYAEDRGLKEVLIGSHAGDREVYPDCRVEFTKAFSEAANFGTYNGVKVLAPYSVLKKEEIAQKGRELGFDFSMTWTCYNAGPKHCGRCASCNSRRSALSGFDPTEYED